MTRRVYFIKPIGMDGPVKIGCSVSPDSRRETLQTWCPFPLEVVAEIDGDFGLERRFHYAFADSYLKHEWFNWTPALAETIARIVAGTFDVSELPSSGDASRFRKARNNSYYTPEWRYGASVQARFRTRGLGWPWWNKEFCEIVGDDRNNLLGHRDQIEALIDRLSLSTGDLTSSSRATTGRAVG